MVKKFKLEVEITDTSINMNAENTGLNAMEIIGILEAKKQDVLNQVLNAKRFEHKRIAEVDGEKIEIKEKENG